MRKLALLFVILAAGCATNSQEMRVPSEEEARACEARGGTIEPAHAIDTYVCLLPSPQPAPPARPPS